MDFYTFTLVIIICFGLYYYFKKKLKYFEELEIPYLPGWPVLGNLAPSLLRQKHFSEVLDDIYYVSPDAKYVGAFDLMTPTLLIRDPELIKSVTIKNFDYFHDHALSIDPTVDPLGGTMLFNMSGDKWREARNLLSPAFTSSKLKGMFELMTSCIKNYMDFLSKQTDEDNRMINTKDFFTRFSNDVIATCTFGIEIDSLKDPKNDFYVLGKEATNLNGALSIKFFLARALPGFMKFFKIKFVDDHVKNFFLNVVKSTVDIRDKNGMSRPDMIQLMMKARNNENKNLNIVEMTSQAFSFFFGGFDTTSTQMCVIAHELAINPDVQEKLQKEIDQVLENGKPTYEAINEMPYLDAVFNESLRLHTQAVLTDRRCTKDFELPPALPGLKPFTIKAGTYIWISLSSIHKDPKYYENPRKFDPDRYFNKKVNINDPHNLAFGIGPRACIGNRFAILETKILFFFLLSKFNLRPNEKTMSPLKYSKKNLSITAEGGFWLSIVHRNV